MDKAYLGASKYGKKRGWGTVWQKIAVMVSKDNVSLWNSVHL